MLIWGQQDEHQIKTFQLETEIFQILAKAYEFSAPPPPPLQN